MRRQTLDASRVDDWVLVLALVSLVGFTVLGVGVCLLGWVLHLGGS